MPEDYELPTDPYQEPVNGSALLDEIVAAFTKYTVLPDRAPEVLTLWTVATHAVHDANFTHAPRLLIVAPTPDSGKSTVMTMLAHLVLRPDIDSGTTEASLLRAINQKPTLCLDEADQVFPKGGARSGLVRMLNSGHLRGGFERKSEYDRKLNKWVPVKLPTFAMAAITGIGQKWIGATLRSRSYMITLHARMPDDHVADFHIDDVAPVLRLLRSKIVRWTLDNLDALRRARPKIDMINRVADNAKVLCAVADVAGGPWPQRARDTIVAYTPTLDGDPRMLLAHIRELLCDPDDPLPRHKIGADGPDDLGRVYSLDLCERLRTRVDWPYGSMTQHSLAADLRPFRIHTHPSWEGSRGSRKGQAYWLSQFVEPLARCRILPISPTQCGRPVDGDGSSTSLPDTSGDTTSPDGDGYWLMPPDDYARLDAEFHFDFDPCPYPREEGYDGLAARWHEHGTVVFVNWPFRRRNGKDRKGPAEWIKKAVDEQRHGVTSVFVLPSQPSHTQRFIEAGAELRSMARIRWLDTRTGEPMRSPPPTICAILRGHPVQSTQSSRPVEAPPPPKPGRRRRAKVSEPSYKSGDQVWLHYGRNQRQLAEIVCPSRRSGRYKVRKRDPKTEEWSDSRLSIMAAQIIGLATDAAKPNGFDPGVGA